jgi:Ca2+-binding RTX toxin-like protein
LGAGNVDTITDFRAGIDLIRIDNAVFTGLAANELRSGQFHIGTVAADGNDHIIYNSTNGNLFFDVDGLRGARQVQFAKLDPGLALTAADFFVI